MLKNNLAFGNGKPDIAGSVDSNNSWNGLTVNGSGRRRHGRGGTAPSRRSLPASDFLDLAPGSGLIDKGVDVGLPFLGAAPDLGAYGRRAEPGYGLPGPSWTGRGARSPQVPLAHRCGRPRGIAVREPSTARRCPVAPRRLHARTRRGGRSPHWTPRWWRRRARHRAAGAGRCRTRVAESENGIATGAPARAGFADPHEVDAGSRALPITFQGGRPGTCQPLRAEGEPCSTSTQCQPTLECDRERTGTCVPLVGIGEACTGRAASCDPILGFCDPASGTCQPRLPVGAPCDATIADANGGCVHHASCAHGACVEQPGIGEPCSAPDGGDSRAVCRNGRCASGTCQVTSCAACP